VSRLGDLLDLDADPRVGPHPLYLLAERRDAVQITLVECHVDRDDVRLSVLSARDTSNGGPLQNRLALIR
jgi:hypothetical protein